jgi:hypothetical protein
LAFPPADPEVMYDLARNRFDSQLAAVESLDAKLAAFFGVGSALLGIVAAIYAIKPAAFAAGGWLVLALAMIVYVALAAACLAGMAPRVWDVGPAMEAIYNDHKNFSPTEIKWRASGTLLRLANQNKVLYDQKAGKASLSPILLAVLGGLVVASAVQVGFQASGFPS